MTTRPAPRSAFTLVELVIAMAILGTVMVIALQTLVSARSYDATAAAQDDLFNDAARVMAQLREDFSSSAWEFPGGTLGFSGVTAEADRGLLYFPYVQIQSPGTPPITTGLGGAFPWTHRPAGLVRLGGARLLADGKPGIGVAEDFDRDAQAGLDAAVLRGEAAGLTAVEWWNRSFFARSQELLLLRATVSAWDTATDRMATNLDQAPLLSFRGVRQLWATPYNHDALQIHRASGWYATKDAAGNVLSWNPCRLPGSTASADESPYGVVLEAGYLRDPSGDIADIGMNWRMLDGSAYAQDVSTPAGLAAYIANLQAFMYCVVPSPTGFGRLVRARKVAGPAGFAWADPAAGVWPDAGRKIAESGGYGMVVDRVLSDNVMRICFDTYRTVDAGAAAVTTLDINQVRVRLFLGARAGTGGAITRSVESVIALRGRNTQVDKDFEVADSAAATLGQAPVGLPR